MFSGKDGGDAAAQHVVDRSAVSQKGCGHPLRVQKDAHVHICLCVLPEQEQSVGDLRGK